MLFARIQRSAAAAAIAVVWAGAAPAVAAGTSLAAHRAVYDLMLDRSGQTTDLADMTGRIVMEFSGSECSGYSMALRFVTEISDQEGGRRITDARTRTYEGGDGSHFKFTNETFIDDALTEESRGQASRSKAGVAVTLSKPDKKDFVLDKGVVFPTAQIERIIDAARQNQKFLQLDVYDGTEDGETVYATTVLVGNTSYSRRDIGDEIATERAGIAGLRHWPVTVSYFDQETQGEQTPIYVMSFILYENGISRHLKIDYGDFAIVGRLSGLEMLPLTPCPAAGSRKSR